jgi:ATP-binding cassette subfamily B (MDR/TAP) protein 1
MEAVLVSMMCVMGGAMGAGMAMGFAPDANKAKLAAYDVFRLIDRESKVDAMNPQGNHSALGDGSIEFQDVKFTYPHRLDLPILKGLSWRVPKGKSVAFVGPSGSGKSTVIQLLQRFYDPTLGTIKVGGTDLRQFDITYWRQQVGFVGQEPILFEMSLEDNVRYGKPDATRDEVEVAAKMANMDYVFDGKMTWEDSVGAKGGKLSGGQKQRCAIARALIRQPPVLLLDEATSALDSVSERVVQHALDVAKKGRTTFTIAHRLSTIQDCDVIIVIVAGAVVEQGSHEVLMERKGVYSNLVRQGRS